MTTVSNQAAWVCRACSYGCFSAEAGSAVSQQPSNANEKTQLISDGKRRYADSYT